jgi:hypothetical protein
MLNQISDRNGYVYCLTMSDALGSVPRTPPKASPDMQGGQEASRVGIAVWPQQWIYRHGPVLVVADLACHHGPAAGIVERPLWLYWSGEHGRFDLDNPAARLMVYATVLPEARALADLTDYLDGDILVRMWPKLSSRLPNFHEKAIPAIMPRPVRGRPVPARARPPRSPRTI